MVFTGRIPCKIRAYIKYHKRDIVKHKVGNRELIEILATECNITTRSVYRLLKEPITQQPKPRGGGRPRKVDERTTSRMIRNIRKIRQDNKNWVCKDLLDFTDIKDISERTCQRILHEFGYKFAGARKKGLMQKGDAKKRLAFAKKWKEKDDDFWKKGIAFYFDGTGFTHKTNPYEDAMTCRGKNWRKDSEGLDDGCTSKGSKEGSGGRQAKFFVAISYDKGVILAEQYDHLDGDSFAKFIGDHFADLFEKSGKRTKKWLQDGDPSQNSAKSVAAQKKIGAKVFPIPPRSPELNPIENLFAFVKKELRTNAIAENIHKETYAQFSLRVKHTLLCSDKDRINNIIGSYGRRLSQLILRKGGKIDY